MQLREVPAPELIQGTVLVRNHVIALNFGDTVFIRGRDRGAAADGEILPMP
jgi:NADPH:quinone reductase-like Zn-dependent oxidoreductase